MAVTAAVSVGPSTTNTGPGRSRQPGAIVSPRRPPAIAFFSSPSGPGIRRITPMTRSAPSRSGNVRMTPNSFAPHVPNMGTAAASAPAGSPNRASCAGRSAAVNRAAYAARLTAQSLGPKGSGGRAGGGWTGVPKRCSQPASPRQRTLPASSLWQRTEAPSRATRHQSGFPHSGHGYPSVTRA